MKKLITATLGILIIIGCSKKTTLQHTSPLTDDWVLETIPNSLDNIGTVFAIKGNKQTYLSGINIKSKEGVAEIPGHKINKNVSAKAFLGFLNVKGLDSTSLGVSDSTTIRANFDVKGASYLRAEDNLMEAFESQKKNLIDNINFLNLSRSDIYFVSEILKSSTVNINLNKSTNSGIGLKSLIGKILNLHSDIKVNNKDTTALIYDLKEPLVIFYKLNKIKLDYIKGRGKDPKDSVWNAKLQLKPVQKI